MSGTARCVPLAESRGLNVGGKAAGLARLAALGFSVPDAFVVVGATEDDLPADLERAYQSLGGGRVAVRSSAADEDGEAASFAGQHETILGVEGVDALREALVACLRSVASERALAYRATRANADGAAMCVVVQRMVEARCAGVLFSADPVTSRRDRVVVDAVRGLGDALVSGLVTPDHFLLARDGTVVTADLSGTEACLGESELARLVAEGLRIESHFGGPIDCEWAVDASGSIAWLQARPITTLVADPRELDSEPRPGDVYTRCNIGEMMPGAATPLTWSTSIRGIDYGMQRMYSAIGLDDVMSDGPVFVGQWFGHLFLDLTRLASIAPVVAGASEEDAVAAICGRSVPEVVASPRAPSWVRVRNGLAYANIVLRARTHVEALDALLASVSLPSEADARATYAAIDRELPKLFEAYHLHLAASTLAGAVASALLQIVAEGATPTESHHARVASLLAGAEGVLSHDIASGIDRIVASLLAHDGARLAELAALDVREADRFLRTDASAESRAAYLGYFERHGHRCVREVELREREWSEDPSPIVDAVRSGVRAAQSGHAAPPKPASHAVPFALRPLVALGQRGVRAREDAKSRLVKVTVRFKQAYRGLARQLVAERALPDPDLVHFLQHAELGRLVREGDAALARLASARRETLPFQMRLAFPDVFVGKPEPVPPPLPSGDGVVRGKPVSRGVVRGRARVALTLAEASLAEPGDILIAPITDVGWTPCFATIAGLATDVGSAVSHGAVVAREYGLPALVDLRIATATFRTGDWVELDADAGVLRRVPER